MAEGAVAGAFAVSLVNCCVVPASRWTPGMRWFWCVRVCMCACRAPARYIPFTKLCKFETVGFSVWWCENEMWV